MMMMMIMIAGFVDSITTPFSSWLDNLLNHHNTSSMTVRVDAASPVDCIVCLSEVGVGERLAMLDRCRHEFHVDCVEAWLKDHPNCPLCRSPVSGWDEDAHKHTVYMKKLYDVMSCYGVGALESICSWLTSSFSQGLQSSLSQSCSYL